MYLGGDSKGLSLKANIHNTRLLFEPNPKKSGWSKSYERIFILGVASTLPRSERRHSTLPSTLRHSQTLKKSEPLTWRQSTPTMNSSARKALREQDRSPYEIHALKGHTCHRRTSLLGQIAHLVLGLELSTTVCSPFYSSLQKSIILRLGKQAMTIVLYLLIVDPILSQYPSQRKTRQPCSTNFYKGKRSNQYPL